MDPLLIEKILTPGMVFETSENKWSVSVVNDPGPGSPSSPYPDMMLLDLKFESTGTAAPEVRRLRLWTLHSQLRSNPGYPDELLIRIQNWLAASKDIYGEIWCFTDRDPGSTAKDRTEVL